MREASARSMDMYVASVRDRLRHTLQKAQANQPQKKADKNGTMTEK